MIEIKRIDTYDDARFSDKVLSQHGAFLVNDSLLYEIEIISQTEAIIRGCDKFYEEVIEEFRFFAEHITIFYDEQGNVVKEFAKIPIFDVKIEEIQPSQFYVDITKKQEVSKFVCTEEDIIIPLVKYGDKFISMDGHTRLAVAIDKGFKEVKGFLAKSEDWLYEFANEAEKRHVHSPYDLETLTHEEYEVKWNRFCDEFFG